MLVLLQTTFVVSVFVRTLFFLAYNLFQCLQPLQTIYFKIFEPPLPKGVATPGFSLKGRRVA